MAQAFPPAKLLQKLNPILRGRAHFYRFCTGAKDILTSLDWYVGDRLWRWMRKKFPKANAHWLLRHSRRSHTRPTWRVWQNAGHEQYIMGWLTVQRYRRGWMVPADFTLIPGEPDA